MPGMTPILQDQESQLILAKTNLITLNHPVSIKGEVTHFIKISYLIFCQGEDG